jgi:hypothetical protein
LTEAEVEWLDATDVEFDEAIDRLLVHEPLVVALASEGEVIQLVADVPPQDAPEAVLEAAFDALRSAQAALGGRLIEAELAAGAG